MHGVFVTSYKISLARLPPRPPVKLGRQYVPRGEVAKKTADNCHMCGEALGDGWQIGHIQPYRLGGQCSVENCLPICAECNRLRWSYEPRVLRFMLQFGRYAKQEIRGRNGTPTELGEQLIQLHIRNTWRNHRRRRKAGT